MKRVLSLVCTLTVLIGVTTGCSNIIRTGLMNSNTIFLDPNTNRTIYTQLRNASENQQVTLTELNTKLTAKGYQLAQDPEHTNYWIQAKVIYCHKAAEGVTPESVAKAGAGAGISSGGAAMVSSHSMGGDQAGRGMPLGGYDRNGRDAYGRKNAGHERLDGAGHGHERWTGRVPRYAHAPGCRKKRV